MPCKTCWMLWRCCVSSPGQQIDRGMDRGTNTLHLSRPLPLTTLTYKRLDAPARLFSNLASRHQHNRFTTALNRATVISLVPSRHQLNAKTNTSPTRLPGCSAIQSIATYTQAQPTNLLTRRRSAPPFPEHSQSPPLDLQRPDTPPKTRLMRCHGDN